MRTYLVWKVDEKLNPINDEEKFIEAESLVSAMEKLQKEIGGVIPWHGKSLKVEDNFSWQGQIFRK